MFTTELEDGVHISQHLYTRIQSDREFIDRCFLFAAKAVTDYYLGNFRLGIVQANSREELPGAFYRTPKRKSAPPPSIPLF